jgi:hypothetical protein
MIISKRYEKGQKFLDLVTYTQRSIDEDGLPVIDQCWECFIYENGSDPDEHKFVEFGSEALALMFIKQNGWKEQVL